MPTPKDLRSTVNNVDKDIQNSNALPRLSQRAVDKANEKGIAELNKRISNPLKKSTSFKTLFMNSHGFYKPSTGGTRFNKQTRNNKKNNKTRRRNKKRTRGLRR